MTIAKTIEDSKLVDTAKYHSRTFQNIHGNVFCNIKSKQFICEKLMIWEKIAC
jgi:hypothetical protein